MKAKKLILALLITLLATTALAESQLKIALLHSQDILAKSRQWEHYQSVIKAEREDLTAQQIDKQHEINRKIKEMRLLPPDKQEAERRKLEEFAQMAEAEFRNKIMALEEKRKEFAQQFEKNVREAAVQVAKKNGYDLVLSSQICLYSKYDISDAVVKRMNANYDEKNKKEERTESD
ncbi:MAG: OmpH family outer membrane protein [Thermoplasmata archaeon]|nr:OmpH family outer membrane protein [Thermoplasmata archaeon]